MKKFIDHLPDIVLFTYLIDHKTFTALSEHMQIHKSIISKRIKNLEKNLGVQLITRTTRSLKLTEAGSLLYERASLMKNDFSSIYAELSDLNTQPKGTIRISTPSSFGQEHLISIINKFTHHHPDIKFKLFVGKTYQSIVKHRIDIGFHMGDLPDSGLIAKKLKSQKMIVCASQQYIKQYGQPNTPDELDKHNCLTLVNKKEKTWSFIDNKNQDLCIAVSGNLSATSMQALKYAAINDVGIVMLPEYCVVDDIIQGRLMPLLSDYKTLSTDFYALYANATHLPKRLRLFLDFVAEEMNSFNTIAKTISPALA